MALKLLLLSLTTFIVATNVAEARTKCYECNYLVFDGGVDGDTSDDYCEDGEDTKDDADKTNCNRGCSKYTLEFTTYTDTDGYTDVTWHGRGCADGSSDSCSSARSYFNSNEELALELSVEAFYSALFAESPTEVDMDGGTVCECPDDLCNGASLPMAMSMLPFFAFAAVLMKYFI